jgi:maltose O-acetyltransferase
MYILSSLANIYHRIVAVKRKRYIEGLKRKGMRIGKNVDIIADFFFDPSHCFLISIGDNCTICPNVRLIAHDASTKKILGYTKIGKIEIRENSFIGDSAIVLPNVRIGPNSIVGAGSVVSRDIPANVVASGNPARVMGTTKDYLSKFERMSQNIKAFSEEYSINNLDDKKRREILSATMNSLSLIR